MSGFRASMRYYAGFFEPPIETPCVHTIGTVDVVISRDLTTDLISSCRNAVVYEHYGVHCVPTDRKILDQIVESTKSMLARRTTDGSVSWVSAYNGPLRRCLPQGTLHCTDATSSSSPGNSERGPLTPPMSLVTSASTITWTSETTPDVDRRKRVWRRQPQLRYKLSR